MGRVPRSDQSRRIPVLWACCPGVGAVAAFAGMARARDRSSLHAVRKENNGRKSWFRFSTVSFSPFSSFILPAAGLTTLAACSAAPAARARACVPEVPARSFPASAGLGRAGSLPRWPWPRRPVLVGLGLVDLGLIPVLGLCLWFRPWPHPRPRPSFRPASGARVTGWFSAGGCRARGRRALPSSPALRCRPFSSALLAVTSLALMPLRRPS